MNDAQQTNAYQTGPTTPPKSHIGRIAVILAVVIFFTGLIRLLQLLNIPLFQLSASQENQDISAMSQAYAADPQPAAYQTERSTPEIQGQAISPVCGNYYGLPQGIYITAMAESSELYAQGLRSGDILLEINGTPITDTETLEALLNSDQTLHICYERQGQQYEITVGVE